MFGVSDDSLVTFLIVCCKFYIYRCKFQEVSPNFVDFKRFLLTKRKTEYCIAYKKGNCPTILRNGLLIFKCLYEFMYAYVLLNSCCTCLFDCTFLWLFVIFFLDIIKKIQWQKKKKKKKKKNWGYICIPPIFRKLSSLERFPEDGCQGWRYLRCPHLQDACGHAVRSSRLVGVKVSQ